MANESPLSYSVQVFNTLKDHIGSQYNLDGDDQVLIDTVSGETNFDGLAAALIRESIICGEMATGIKKLVEAMKTRQARLLAKQDRLRATVSWAMQETGQKKITAPDFTISIRAGKPGLNIDEMDPSALPDEFATVTVVTTPNKAAIRDALEAGRVLQFARLGNASPVLSVHTK